MNKKHALAAVILIAIAAAWFGWRSAPVPQQPQVTQAPAKEPYKPKPFELKDATKGLPQIPTQEVTQTAQATTSAQPAQKEATSEVNVDNIQWARDYLKKYIGKIPDPVLLALNDWVKASDNDDIQGFHKNLQFILENRVLLFDLVAEIANDDLSSEYLTSYAVEILGKSKKTSKFAEKVLILKTSIHFPKKVRAGAITSLQYGGYKGSEVTKKMNEIINNPDDPLRRLTLTHIWAFNDDTPIKETIKEILASKSESNDVKVAAVIGFRNFEKDKESIEILHKIINDELSTSLLKGEALICLAGIKGEDITSIINEFLSSKDEELRGYAVQAGLHMHNIPEKVVDLYIKILCDTKESDYIRRSICCVLRDAQNSSFLLRLRENFLKMDKTGILKISEIFLAHKDIESIPILRAKLNESDDKEIIESLNNAINSIEGVE